MHVRQFVHNAMIIRCLFFHSGAEQMLFPIHFHYMEGNTTSVACPNRTETEYNNKEKKEKIERPGWINLSNLGDPLLIEFRTPTEHPGMRK